MGAVVGGVWGGWGGGGTWPLGELLFFIGCFRCLFVCSFGVCECVFVVFFVCCVLCV